MAAAAPEQSERQALCDAMLHLGPTAPTLCEGWNTRDLAVHLVIRERHLLAASGIVLGGPLRRLLDDATARVGQRPYEELVFAIRRGPPQWLRPFDHLINVNEYFVHYEDVRRGAGDTTPRPSADTAALDDALWKLLRHSGRLLARPLHAVGLVLRRPGGDDLTARRGTPTATISGRPGEIVLYLMGRKAAAHVEVDGPAEAVAAVQAASFGF